MMKKVMAFVLALFAVVSFAGCGKSFEGYYVGEALENDGPYTYVMEVKPNQGSKGYMLSVYRAEYSEYLNTVGRRTYGGTSKYKYSLIETFQVTDPKDSGVLHANLMGMPIDFSVDKEGNILDKSGFTTSTLRQQVRTYKKKDGFKEEDLKADLQKRAMEYYKKKYNTGKYSTLNEESIKFEG